MYEPQRGNILWSRLHSIIIHTGLLIKNNNIFQKWASHVVVFWWIMNWYGDHARHKNILWCMKCNLIIHQLFPNHQATICPIYWIQGTYIYLAVVTRSHSWTIFTHSGNIIFIHTVIVEFTHSKAVNSVLAKVIIIFTHSGVVKITLSKVP